MPEDGNIFDEARKKLNRQRNIHMQEMTDQAMRTINEQVGLARMQQQETERQEQGAAPAVQIIETMETEGGWIEEQAPPIRKETRAERKKREELEKANRKAQKQAERAAVMEMGQFAHRFAHKEEWTMAKEERRLEAKLRNEKIKAVKLAEEARLLELEQRAAEIDKRLKHEEETEMLLEMKKDLQAEKLQIQWEEQEERARIWADYARMLQIETHDRADAMERKEEEELKAHKLARRLEVMRMADTDERKTRKEEEIARHEKYDFLKGIFRENNPLSHEDATYIVQKGEGEVGLHLVNVGRAYSTGTKPIYVYEDRNAPIYDAEGNVTGYEKYLFKEAINCIGFTKPEGALVTEAASRLQEKICGPYAIPAFAAVHEGKVLGSFQKKIDTAMEENGDLISWQVNPNAEGMLSGELVGEILREHTLDWLLCNFDAKAENFLFRKDGHLCSIDKEASFIKLMDRDAAHMNTTFRPHGSDTLYNTLFREYAAGQQEIDLSAAAAQIEKVEQIPDEEYLGLFDKMLEQKYGRPGEKNKARAKVERAILERKTRLREEYCRFFKELVEQRRESLQKIRKLREETIMEEMESGKITNEEAQARFAEEQRLYSLLDDSQKWLDEKGHFHFS